MENYKIYALKLKDEEIIRYVGLTKKTLMDRFKRHLRITSKMNTKNGNWINKHKDNIEIILIEEDIKTTETASEREIYWIKYYTEIGNDLTNGTLGGFKGEPTEETRNKLSESQKGKKLSQETKDKIRSSLIGRNQTSEHIENTKRSKIGYKHSVKSRENIGNSRRNKPLLSSRKLEVSYFINGEIIDIFETYAECARFLNISKSCIYDVLHGKCKKSHGYVFRFID
jgi:group I intron endonuclease